LQEISTALAALAVRQNVLIQGGNYCNKSASIIFRFCRFGNLSTYCRPEIIFLHSLDQEANLFT